MSINFKITELECSSSLNKTDLLMISKRISENIYSSYKINLTMLLTLFDNKFEKSNMVKVDGIWKVTSGGIFIHDKNIVEKTSVINLKYAYNTFMEKLNSLKNMIYETPYMPSSVGEFIFSTNLNTIEKVRKKYGLNTDWDQIQGRFIMGGSNISQSNTEIGKLAGSVNVSLELKNIPLHYHRLIMNNSKKTISLNEIKELSIKNVCVMGIKAEPTVRNDNSTTSYCIYPGNRKLENDMVVETEVGNQEHTKIISINAKGKVSVNSGNNLGHNNIPPFYSVYIWRRKS